MSATCQCDLFAAAPPASVYRIHVGTAKVGPPARLPRAEQQRLAAAYSENAPSILLELAMVLRLSLRGAAACLHANCLLPLPPPSECLPFISADDNKVCVHSLVYISECAVGS